MMTHDETPVVVGRCYPGDMDCWPEDGYVVDCYVAYCYGEQGNEPREVPLAIVPAVKDGVNGWTICEVPDECTLYTSVFCASEEEALEMVPVVKAALEDEEETP